MMREVADEVAGLRVSGAAHWIAEENPAAFTAGLLEFLTQDRERTPKHAREVIAHLGGETR
jgi:hypothetical protein